MNLSQEFHRACSWIDAHSPKEKIVLLLLTGSFLYFLWHFLLMAPLNANVAKSQKAIVTAQESIKKMKKQSEDIIEEAMRPLNPEDLKKKAQLQAQTAELDRQVQAVEATMIMPAQVPEILQLLLKPVPGIYMKMLTNAPAQEFMPADSLAPPPLVVDKKKIAAAAQAALANAKKPAMSGVKKAAAPVDAASLIPGEQPVEVARVKADRLYAHPIHLDITGNYFGLVTYLQSLEDSSWRFFLDSLDYTVSEYPNAKIQLRLHLLSPQGNLFNV